MKGLLASVGNISLFTPDSNNTLVLQAKTLTESGITMGVSAEEARGGEGNYLLGQYFHDTNFSMKLTDQIWDLQYLAMNCGGRITRENNLIMVDEELAVKSNIVTVSETPVSFGGRLCGWVKKTTDDDNSYTTIDFTDTNKLAFTAADNTKVCVKYFKTDSMSRNFTVNANFVPSVYHAILTIPLFQSGMTEESFGSSSKIGTIQVDIPRFQLDGAQELSLTASGISNVSLSGKALATTVDSCDGQGYYARITEIINGQDEWDGVEAIVIANSNIVLGTGETETLKVYKLYKDGSTPVLVDNTDLTFTPETGCTVTTAGVVSATADSSITVVAGKGTDDTTDDLYATCVVEFTS